jgi:hypothetical protein
MQPVSIPVLATALLSLPAGSAHAGCEAVVAAIVKAAVEKAGHSAGADDSGLRWVYGSSMVPPASGTGT